MAGEFSWNSGRVSWDGKVQIIVADCDAEPMEVKLRIPGWATSATLKINGEPDATQFVPRNLRFA